MHKYLVLSASIVLFAGVLHSPSAASAQASCLEDDRGYQLIKADGTIDPVRLYGLAVKKFAASSLKDRTIPELHRLGVTTGDPREWARLFVMVCKQESGCRIARTYADGSLEKFSSTLPGERSYGPLQFNIGEYGLNSWAMVNSPSCTVDAFIRVVERTGSLSSYFGSIRRPNEVMRHAGWFNTTVQPFQDALTLVFDPNAPDMRTYQAVAPYFVNPYDSRTLGLYSGAGTNLGNGLSAYSAAGAYPSGANPTPNYASPLSYQQSVQQPLTADTLAPSAPSRYAANLLIQPKKAKAGDKVLISWTSVGMSSTAGCSVVVDDVGAGQGGPFATGAAGSKQWTATAGSHTFQLICLPANASVFAIMEAIAIQ